jgi:(1->4)-alpha-D-glucan 1-alpha-D-glucosylmutase
MSTPLATYRLQLREGMTFARAAAIAPYLQQLGISHVYLSPIFRAVPGSTHGYDAADFNELAPELGGEVGFAELVAALHSHDLKAIVDFVPNHMGASPASPWWRDVLEWGSASTFAQHFDVDWSAPKLIIPTLGKPYGEALAAGELRLRFNPQLGEFQACYFDVELPLTPPTYAAILSLADSDKFAELARRFAAATPDDAAELRSDLVGLAATPGVAETIESALTRFQDDKLAMHGLLEQQAWRLAHWRASRESLTYRRFFEISDLVGVRVEQTRVFDDVHRTILALVKSGHVDGLRIDHVDGVADPLGYLNRLRREVGEATYIVVEKILGQQESLRAEWPVQGTTGYEFIRDASNLFVAESELVLSRAYADFIGRETDVAAEAIAIKRRTITRNLAGELDVLTGQALDLAQGDIDTRDYGADTLRRAIIELGSNLSVYRTYVDAGGAKAEDRAVLSAAAAAAKASREVEDETAIDLIVRYMLLELDAPERQAKALAFTTRFQQTTGPLMAKAMEDTLFYRFNRLIALNEVGGEPAQLESDISAFHHAMEERQDKAAQALTATATHDTKRGEDARCRIYAVSEMAETWAAAVPRWSALLGRDHESQSRIPEPEMEWLFYQSLLGAWPGTFTPDGGADLDELCERLVAFMQKAAREAKLHTSWTQPDTAYETELAEFVRAAFAYRAFLDDFYAIARPLMLAGAVNSFAQLMIKLFAPGVPDIFQGSEFWDLSLVDPDNRRSVDFDARGAVLQVPSPAPARLLEDWKNGAVKLHCLQRGLDLRRQLGEPLNSAEYLALTVVGPLSLHVVAFARILAQNIVIVVCARFTLGLLHDVAVPHIAAHLWQDTFIEVPAALRCATVEDILTRQALTIADGQLAIGLVLSEFPLAVLAGTRS